MTAIDVRSPDGTTAGTVELPAAIFDAPANTVLMHQVVVAQLAAARQGTHSTKTRGEVRGGGAKPYRQKGTGRARQGSSRAPQFEGGGIVHGPKPRDYSQRTPKKMKAAALRGALSDRAREGRVHVVSAFVDGEVPSTKAALQVLSELTATVERCRRVLVVVDGQDTLSWKSLRNVGAVHLLAAGQLNTYDVLVSDVVIFTEDALSSFLDAAARTRTGKGSAHETALPDLGTPDIPGGVPSIAPAEGAGEVDVSLTKPSPAETAAKPAAEVEPKAADLENHPYGADSQVGLEDGSAPEGYPVRGDAGAKTYAVPNSAGYDNAAGDVWFTTEQAAQAADFSAASAVSDTNPEAADEAADEEENQ